MPKSRGTRQWEHIGRLQIELADAFRHASAFKLTHAQTLERVARVRESREYQRLPQWAHWYLRGIEDTAWATLSNQMEWRVYLDGAHIPGDAVPAGAWSRVDGDKGCCFWPGTDRPWSPTPVPS